MPKFKTLNVLDAWLLILIATLVLLLSVKAFAQFQPPVYVTPDSDGGYTITQPGNTKEPPAYVEPLPYSDPYSPRYQIIQPGKDVPPAYIAPDGNGSAVIIQPGKK
jgi:hypothetical protein